jgi:glucose-1-phosphate thymidylyltransferase
MAAGTGSRMFPLTRVLSKHLLPVYDKPMIYYPLSTLMLSGIREVNIVVNPGDFEPYSNLLGDGSNYGIHITYTTQNNPGGIAEGISLSRQFIGENNFALILGDNFFYGSGLGGDLANRENPNLSTIFAYKVGNPSDYGVVEFDSDKSLISIEEKPQIPKSNYAIPGLYYFNSIATEIAEGLEPSKRGELEITDIHKKLMHLGKLEVVELSRGTVWLDMGSPDSLNSASNFVKMVQDRQQLSIGSIEEIAWRNGWITEKKLLELSLGDTTYANYLKGLLGINSSKLKPLRNEIKK